VKQIQGIDNKVVAAYPDRLRDDLQIKPEDMETLRQALIAVTEDGQGTAHHAQVKGYHVAGKTGTAQWGGGGNKDKQRTAAWFAGFVPAENPQYAFAAVYEGEPGDNNVHGGSHAAPLIGKVLEQVYGSKEDKEKEAKTASTEPSDQRAASDKSDHPDKPKDQDQPTTDQSN
jgi:penicillin-binding protein 2